MRIILAVLALVLASAASAQPVDLRDFGVVCDGSDETAKVAAAVAATPPGGTLRNSCQSLVGLGPTDATASVYVKKPIKIECINGGGFIPLPSLGNTTSVFYFVGVPSGSYLPTTIEGCFIGNNSLASRYGHHAVVFDALAPGARFNGASIRRSYIQQNDASSGRGIFVINNPAVNPVGGLHNTTLCDNSLVYGGISLNNVGDSIIFRNCASQGKHDVYVNLVHDRAGKAGNFVFDGGPITNEGGLVIDCAASAQVLNVEAEQNLKTTNRVAALYHIAGGTCLTENVVIRSGQVQSDPSKGLKRLIFVENAVGTVLDDLRLASPTPDINPIVVASGARNTLIGEGLTLHDGGPVINDSPSTKRSISIPYRSGTVTLGDPDSCGRGFRCLRIAN